MTPGDRVETLVLGEWAPGRLVRRTETGAWLVELDTIVRVGDWTPFSVVYRSPADVRPLTPPLVPAERVRLAAARFVAEHWRDAALAWDLEDARIVGAVTHPLACVLAALDGEVDPTDLGLTPDAHDAFRAVLDAVSGE